MNLSRNPSPRKAFALFLAIVVLLPAAVQARIGEGDRSFRALLEPSKSYGVVVYPLFAVAVVASVFALGKCRHLGLKLRRGAVLLISEISVFSGLVLVGACPLMYRYLYDSWLRDGPYMWGDLGWIGLLPPILAVTKPWAGVLLVVIWFAAQPYPVQVVERWIGEQPDAEPSIKVRVWPVMVLPVLFLPWFFLALGSLVFTTM